MGFTHVNRAGGDKDADINSPKTFSSDKLRKLFKFDARKIAGNEACEMAGLYDFNSWMNDARLTDDFDGVLRACCSENNEFSKHLLRVQARMNVHYCNFLNRQKAAA